MKTKLLFSVLPTLCLSTMVYAAPLFQAGNIEDGQKWTISDSTGVASYFANGKSGKVEFNCNLRGNGNAVKATLETGKNFANIYNLPITELKKGKNGPFIWKLTNEKSDVGNIKVFYKSGKNVSIQCRGKKI